MDIKNFATEDFFEKYEFKRPYLLSASDCESISIKSLLELANEDINNLLNLKLNYSETTASSKTRQSISKLYQTVKEEEIIALGAPVEGIFLVCHSLLESSDHAIVLTPAYDALINIPAMITKNVSYWRLKEHEGKWKLDITLLESLISASTKLLILNFPHNPTGFLPSRTELEQIIEMAKRHDLWIFADEMYKGLEYDNEVSPSIADLYTKCISLQGLSKNAGLPGLRFGWLATKDHSLREKIINWKYYTTLCLSKTSEYLGGVALQVHAELCRKNQEIIKKNFTIANTFFEKHTEKFLWYKAQAGSVSVVKLLDGSAELFCIEMAEKHGIVLLPSKFMGLSDQFFRIGLGRESFAEGLAAFDRVLQ